MIIEVSNLVKKYKDVVAVNGVNLIEWRRIPF